MLSYLYGILLLIENDEEDSKKGYKWNEVKKEAKLSIITDSEVGFATITSNSGNYTLKLKKIRCNSIQVSEGDQECVCT